MNQTDIAAKLGISQSSVSLVLNNPATTRVSEKKKAQIIRLLKESSSLNGAGCKRTWNIGYISDPWQDLHQDFFRESLHGIEEFIADHHYNLMLECLRKNELNLLKRNKVDGLIIRSGKVYELLKSQSVTLPHVLLNCSPEALSCDAVMPDNRGGMFKVVEYLKQKNCRCAAFLGSDSSYSHYSCNYRERQSAFSEACHASGIKLISENISLAVGGNGDFSSLQELCRQWQNLPEVPDAVVTVNHFYAVLVRRYWRDVTIVAGDNKMEHDFESREFAMLIQDSASMGRCAAELLLKRIAEPGRQLVRINCDMKLLLP